MNTFLRACLSQVQRFCQQEDGGTSTVETVLLLPAFFYIFLMSFETGRISLNHVMLERGISLAVRDIRIGELKEPSHQDIKDRICFYARIIPECTASLQVEMVVMDVRNWVDSAVSTVRCIDRALDVQPAVQFTNGDNNQLMVLQVCSLFDPNVPGGALGRSIKGDDGQGYYGIQASSAFVMEPFQ